MRKLLPVLTLLTLLSALPLAAESEVVHSAPLRLDEAVATTLRHAPEIRLAAERAAQRRAALRQAVGVFDASLLLDTRLTYDVDELFGGRLGNEEIRRLRLTLVGYAVEATADGLAGPIRDKGSLLFQQQCGFNQVRIEVPTERGTVVVCSNSDPETGTGFDVVVDFDDEGNLTLLLVEDTTPDFLVQNPRTLLVPELIGELEELGFNYGQDLEAFLSDLFRFIAAQLHLVADILHLQRVRLGGLPPEEQFLTADFLLSHQLRFRNGLTFTSSLSMKGTEDNFADKPLNPAFGDSLVPNAFSTAAGFRLDVPLGEGRGREATAAQELAAEANLAAAEELLAHTAAERVLGTVLAYWRLGAAQERLAALERSAATRDELRELTEELVNADELVRTDLHRVAASAAEAAGEVAAARGDLARARLDLRRATGLAARTLADAPLAAEGLPQRPTVPEGEPAAWAQTAWNVRHDLAAAEHTVRAGDVLARAAEANLKPRFDLSINASYNGFTESFDDRIYDLEGYYRAMTGEIAGPSYGIGLRWTLPLRNNAKRGRLLQAEAIRTRSEIVSADLRRQINLRIAQLLGELENAHSTLEQVRILREAQQKTLEAGLELFRSGEATLVDTLITEADLTSARLAEIDALRRIAELEALLQFEAGRLLEDSGGEDGFDPEKARLVLLTPPAGG